MEGKSGKNWVGSFDGREKRSSVDFLLVEWGGTPRNRTVFGMSYHDVLGYCRIISLAALILGMRGKVIPSGKLMTTQLLRKAMVMA